MLIVSLVAFFVSSRKGNIEFCFFFNCYTPLIRTFSMPPPTMRKLGINKKNRFLRHWIKVSALPNNNFHLLDTLMFSLILFKQGRTRKDPFVHGRLDSSTFPPDKSLSSRWLDKKRIVSYPGGRLHAFWTTGVWFCLSTFLTGNAKCGHLNEKYMSCYCFLLRVLFDFCTLMCNS